MSTYGEWLDYYRALRELFERGREISEPQRREHRSLDEAADREPKDVPLPPFARGRGEVARIGPA